MRKVNKKGFTLVELLVVIVIIGVLLTIGIVSVVKVITTQQKRYNEKQLQLFQLAAQEYFGDNKKLLPTMINGYKFIPLRDLISEKYISEVTDAKGKKCDLDQSKVKITRIESTKYTYEARLVCGVTIGKIDEGSSANTTIVLYHTGERYKYINGEGGNKDTRKASVSNGNIEYYINKELTTKIEAEISSSANIMGYYYKVYREDDKSYKLYKISEQTRFEEEKKNQKVVLEIDSEFLKDGKYKIVVVAIDQYGGEKESELSNVVGIDTVRPRCSVNIEGTEGKINGKKTGWFIESKVVLTISNIKDANKFKWKYTNNKGISPQSNGYQNVDTTGMKIEINNNSVKGLVYDIEVIDKAHNETKCKK